MTRDRPTIEMPGLRVRSKAEVVKAWTPIVTAIIALAGTVVVAVLNSDDVGRSSVQSGMDSIEKQIEYHLNSTMFPEVSKKYNEMLERIVRLEAINDIYKEEISRLRDRLDMISRVRRGEKPEIHRALAPPKPVMLKKSEKLYIPELDIKQQTLE